MKKTFLVLIIILVFAVIPLVSAKRYKRYESQVLVFPELPSFIPELPIGPEPSPEVRFTAKFLFGVDESGQYVFDTPKARISIYYGATFDFSTITSNLRPRTRYTLIFSDGSILKRMRTDRYGNIETSGIWKNNDGTLILVLSKDIKRTRRTLMFRTYNLKDYLYEFRLGELG